jgi:hypothetical protein
MELYLTTMQRMATQLAEVFPPRHQIHGRMSQGHDNPDHRLHFHHTRHRQQLQQQQQQQPLLISYWNVEFYQGYAFPPSRLPKLHHHDDHMDFGRESGISMNKDNHVSSKGSILTNPTLFVNWIGRHGFSAPGRIELQLQGIASSTTMTTTMPKSTLRRPRLFPVTLLFDAHIRYDDQRIQ